MTSTYVTGATPPIHAGVGTLDQLETLLGGAGDVLLVHDAGIAATGLPERVRHAAGAGTRVQSFVAPAGEPTVAIVNAAGRAARALQSPVVIGLGGGTALDIAKLAAGLSAVDDGIEAYLLGAAVLPQRARMIAIPTTSGTGSEVTRTCILSDNVGRKLWVWADALTPEAVILDPELTTTLPPALTLSTGLDAFAHALEACTGQARNHVNEACGLHAIRLARGALERAVVNPADVEARQAMQEAALLGGMAIDSGGTGIAHTIGHALGSLYHAPHGIAVALGLQASLRWSVAGQPERYQAAASQFEHRLATTELAAAFDGWLDRLDFAATVAAAIPTPPDPERLCQAMQTEENQPMTLNNARAATQADIWVMAEQTCDLWSRYAQPSTAVTA